MNRLVKLVGLVVGIAVIDVLVLSQRFLGIEIGGDSVFKTALGVTILVGSFFVLLVGIYRLYVTTSKPLPIKQLKTNADMVQALLLYKDNEVLKKDILFILEQEKRIKKKKGTLLDVLAQRFEPEEMTYSKFTSVIEAVEKLFYINLKNVLNKVSIFDVVEYKSIMEKDTSRFSSQVIKEKAEIYNAYLTFIQEAINTNEEILIDLDKLLLEISRLDTVEMEDIDQMPAIQEINALIQQTKYYK